MVLAIGEVGIRTTLLLFVATSGVGCITVVDHDNVEVSNLHWKVIHTKGRRGGIKDTSVHNAMRALNPTVFVMAVTDPLTWENAMDIGGVTTVWCTSDIIPVHSI